MRHSSKHLPVSRAKSPHSLMTSDGFREWYESVGRGTPLSSGLWNSAENRSLLALIAVIRRFLVITAQVPKLPGADEAVFRHAKLELGHRNTLKRVLQQATPVSNTLLPVQLTEGFLRGPLTPCSSWRWYSALSKWPRDSAIN